MPPPAISRSFTGKALTAPAAASARSTPPPSTQPSSRCRIITSRYTSVDPAATTRVRRRIGLGTTDWARLLDAGPGFCGDAASMRVGYIKGLTLILSLLGTVAIASAGQVWTVDGK